MRTLLMLFATIYGMAIGLLFIGWGIYMTIRCRFNVGALEFYKAQALFLVGLVAVVWISWQTEEFLLSVQQHQQTDVYAVCGVFGPFNFLWPKACRFNYADQ